MVLTALQRDYKVSPDYGENLRRWQWRPKELCETSVRPIAMELIYKRGEIPMISVTGGIMKVWQLPVLTRV